MGVTASNPLEPVFFNKSSGIHFQRPCPSPPVDVLGDSPHRQRYSWLEQSHDTSFSYEGAASLRGNFSPGSLQERTRRTQDFLESSGDDEFYSDSHLYRHQVDSAADSVVFYSEKCHPLYRQASVDSEEMGADLQRKVEAIGRATVQKMENLDQELQDLKQTVLELDADIVGLKVYRPPPQQCWELTNISSSSENGSGIVDVIQHHRTKVWCKGLASPQVLPDEITWDSVARNILDWEYLAENSPDSGSDFGNSFDTDSVDPESSSVSHSGVVLEWDHSCLPEGFSADAVDAAIRKPLNRKRKLQKVSKSMSEDSKLKDAWTKQHRSASMPPQLLAQQIKSVIKTSIVVEEPPSVDEGAYGGLMTSQSASSFPESGVHDLDKFCAERGKESQKDVMEVSGLNWDSAYCEDISEDAVGEEVSFSDLRARIGEHKYWTKISEQLDSENKGIRVRCIRSDGYCILRASLFLCLSSGVPVLHRYGSANAVYDLLTKWSRNHCSWLNEWTFGGKLQYHGPDGFLDCLSTLQRLEDHISEMKDKGSIQEYLVNTLNFDSNTDTKVMEAMKLLMVISAVKMREAGHLAPVFYDLLFAQLEPSWPLDKLDRIGNTCLKQADFYLLGYALSSTLKIFWLQRLDEGDCVCYYPECNLGEWPEITLLLADGNTRCFIPVT